VYPGDFEPEDTEQISETVSGEEKLEWQAELDSALAQIDSRLRDPRRRATDDPEAPFPERRQPEFSDEMLDEIALKVAEHLRRAHVVSRLAVAREAPAPRLQRASAPVRQAAPPPAPEPQLRPGKMMAIRFRWPLFSFRLFSRRKQLHPLSTLNVHGE
jgi:hypothetical protein